MKEVAVGILLRSGHVLACQRKRSARYPLKWEFPGGKVEPGETPHEALQRELREELCIEPKQASEFFRQEWIYGDASDSHSDGAFRVFYFLVTDFSGEPVNRAFEHICWLPPRELQSMDILEGNREAVERLVAFTAHRHTP